MYLDTENEVKNLIFDLGGVIIDIDFDLTMTALKSFTNDTSLGNGPYLEKATFFTAYETGNIDDATFLSLLKETYHLKTSDYQIVKAWNQLLLQIPPQRIELLKKLSTKYRLFLLSNTNPLHFKEVENILRRDTGVLSFSKIFEEVYLSYEVGKIKPDPAIYQFVLDSHYLKPQETLFLDDNELNIESAAKLGIQTVLIQPDSYTILDVFAPHVA